MAGRGRGRGGGAPGQLKGATWQHDPTIKLETKPSELFPPHPNLRKPAPLTEREMRQITLLRELQTKVHRGPLYTQATKRDSSAKLKTFSEEQVNAQYGGNAKAEMDPFTGVETWSMRYAPRKNALPKLSDRPFDESLFPKELWQTLQGNEGDEVKKHLDRIAQKKAGLHSRDPNEKTQRMLDKIANATEGADDEEDAEEEEEAIDSEFDDEDGGDYDAEQYFDDGDGADDDDDGGGGDDF
ncbi:DNA-directed RNA polymerase 3 subunit [Diplocarpon rosae]|nr:DNA-directed RNA polymerase 3 subunit [Diplocarpon rosae]